MRTRGRTIGCFSFALSIALTVAAGSAHAANDRARRSLAHSDYRIRHEGSFSYRRPYLGTAPFRIDATGHPVRFARHQADTRQARDTWRQ
jgi:hypothetical protein